MRFVVTNSYDEIDSIYPSMKNIFFNSILAIVFICLISIVEIIIPTQAYGQLNDSYVATLYSRLGNPGGINNESDIDLTDWSQLLAGGVSTNAWSAAQDIDFDFKFFGVPVTQFQVSHNGLLTFTLQSPLIPPYSGPNQNLPCNLLPLRTITAYWDEFTSRPPTNARSSVYFKTFGTAPHRQLWVKWSLLEYGKPASTSATFACVLEESSNNIYIVDYHYFSGNISATVGLNNSPISAVQFNTRDMQFDNIPVNVDNIGNDVIGFKPSKSIPQNAYVKQVTAPTNKCIQSTEETISFDVMNAGTTPILNPRFQYSINNGTPVVESFSATILPSQTVNLSFATKANLKAHSVYKILVQALLTNDTETINDTASVVIKSGVSQYPYFQDFESGKGQWDLFYPNDASTWAFGTPNKTIFKGAASGVNAWVTNLTGDHQLKESGYVISPCFDFSGLTVPRIYLKARWNTVVDAEQKKYGAGAVLQYSETGGTCWKTVGKLNDRVNWYNVGGFIKPKPGNSPDFWGGTDTASLAGWKQVYHDLPNLGGKSSVIFRVFFESTEGYRRNGFAFDDVKIIEKPLYEVDLKSVMSPVYDGCKKVDEVVSIQLNNWGTTTASNLPVSYSINGGPAVREVIPGPINIGNFNFTFTQKANLSVPGTYIIRAAIALPNTKNASTDTIKTVQIVSTSAIATFPYVQDFESNNGSWSVGGTSSSWTWGTPSKTIINRASSGAKAWVTGLTGTYNTGEKSYVVSPCFDFSQLKNPVLSFKMWAHFNDANFDGTSLQYTIDDGVTWNLVGAFGQTSTCFKDNWFNQSNFDAAYSFWNPKQGWGPLSTGGYVNAFHCLSNLAGQAKVRFRFVLQANLTTQTNGFAFDDFSIRENAINVSDFTYSCANYNAFSFVVAATSCSAATYAWSFGDGASGNNNTATGRTPSHTFSAPGIYTVSVTISEPCQTAKTIQKTLTISSGAVDAGQDTTVCKGTGSIRLHGTGTGAAIWTTTGSGSFTGANTFDPVYTFSVNDAGTLQFSLRVVGECGSSTDTKNVIIAPLPLVDAGPDQTICEGTVTLNATGMNGLQPYSYQWIGGPSSRTWSNVNAGQYTVRVTDANKCTNTDQVTVFPRENINLTVQANRTRICEGESTTITVSGGTTYSWTPATTLDCSDCSFVTAEPSTTTTYTVTAGKCGQTQSKSITIEVMPNPKVQINVSPGENICAGTTIQLTASSDQGCTGGCTYLWSANPTPNVSNKLISNPTATPQVTTVYSVIITNEYQCYGDGKIKINVYKPASVTGSTSFTYCPNTDPVILSQRYTGVSSVTWSPSTGLSDAGTFAPYASPAATTKYTLTATPTNNVCPPIIKEVTVNVPTFPGNVDFENSYPRLTVDFNTTQPKEVKLSSPTYLWSFGDGGTGSSRSSSHTYSIPGIYTVRLTIASQSGNCTLSKYAEKQVVVDENYKHCCH